MKRIVFAITLLMCCISIAQAQIRVVSYTTTTLKDKYYVFGMARDIIKTSGNLIPEDSQVTEVENLIAKANGFKDCREFEMNRHAGDVVKIPVLKKTTNKLNSVTWLTTQHIRMTLPATGNGEPGTLVLVAAKVCAGCVRYVCFIPDSQLSPYKGKEDLPPAIVTELIYHDLGPDKEYLGILVHDFISNDEWYAKEIRLDDTSAQYLLDFQTDDTEWADNTRITFSETKDPNLRQTKLERRRKDYLH